jgi:hypothetical protein
MTLSRGFSPVVALLLALLLPLQGFALAAHCEQAPVSGQAAAPGAAHEHCTHLEHAPSPRHHHHGGCADCCQTAVATAALDWSVPAAVAPELFLPAPRAPLTISLDRLDRPPRQIT